MKFKVGSTDVDVDGASIARTAKGLKAITKLAKRKSIMTMAEPGMYQYPLLASNGIDTDVLMAISKAYQITYASAVATAYSLNPSVYLKETPELSDFVKKFHTNSYIPNNIDSAASALGVESFTDTEDGVSVAVESAMINANIPKEELEAINLGAWDNIEECVSMESLNDIYRPYDRVKRILTDRLKEMKLANEGAIGDAMDDIATGIDSSHDSSTVPLSGKRIQNGKNPDGSIKWTHDQPQGRTYKNEVVKNNQLEALEPTMVNVNLVCHGPAKTGERVQFNQTLTIGVKVMPRIITSDLMIASMIEASKDSHAIFKFLKWTKGEVKTLDWILGISAAKKRALEKNAKQEVRLLSQAKKRKSAGLIGRFLKNEVLPSLTVVLTTYEVVKIQEVTGIDLSDLKNAIKLMNKYYLLSLAIYDTEQNTLQVLFDCDGDWSYTTVGAMKTAMNKTTDILNQKAIYQMFNKR